MAKINNIVRIYEFPDGFNEHSLFYALDKDLDSTGHMDNAYVIKSVQVLNEQQVLAIMEEDNSKIEVRFMTDGEHEYLLNELPSDRMFMSLDEVSLIRKLKQITISDETFAVSGIDYHVELDGVRYVQINITESEEF